MAKITLHLVRHAQGYHNLSSANHTLLDPQLTPHGEKQCETLSQKFPTSASFLYPPKITHLVASPLRRTLSTCLLSFPSQVASGMKVIALPELQETSDLPCDTGSAVSVLAEEYEGKVDLRLVGEGWNSKKGRWSPSARRIEERARWARGWLRELGTKAAKDTGKDVDIAVVTHGAFLHYLTEDWDAHNVYAGTGWANTEFRSYEFAKGETDGSTSLRETEGSRLARKGSEKPLTVEEQRELKAVAERQNAEEGFISVL